MIETERLLCRNLTEDDLLHIHEYASKVEVVKYMEWGPNDLEDTKAFLDMALSNIKEQPRKSYELAIIDKANHTFVGVVGLFILDFHSRKGEIGYSLIPKYWKKGYATEAAKAMVDYGFEQLKLHRIEGTCDVRNAGSRHVLEKLGMKQEGVLREHILLRDGWRDSYIYSILESERGNDDYAT